MFGGPFNLTLELRQPGRDLRQQQLDPVTVVAGCRKLIDSLFNFEAVPAHVCSFLYERSALFGPEAEHEIDHSLTEDGVTVLTQARLQEEVKDVAQPNTSAVEQVFALARAMEPAGDDNLLEFDWQPALGVIEDNADLRQSRRRPFAAARENDVLQPAKAHDARILFTQHPADRVRQITFAASVWADDRGDAAAEVKDCASGEAFETLHFEPAQANGSRHSALPVFGVVHTARYVIAGLEVRQRARGRLLLGEALAFAASDTGDLVSEPYLDFEFAFVIGSLGRHSHILRRDAQLGLRELLQR